MPLKVRGTGEWRCSCCGSNPCRNPRSASYATSIGTVGLWHEYGLPEPQGYMSEESLGPKPAVIDRPVRDLAHESFMGVSIPDLSE